MGKQFKRRTKIDLELSQEIREGLNRLLLEGATYEDAAAWLQENGHDISRSAIGRYGKNFFENYQKLAQFEDQSRALTSSLGDGLAIEEASTKIIFQKIMAAVMSEAVDIVELPEVVNALSRLQRASVLREKLKSEISERVQKAQDLITEKTEGKIAPGDTKALIKEVEKIMGAV